MFWLLLDLIPDSWVHLLIHAITAFGLVVMIGAIVVSKLTTVWAPSIRILSMALQPIGALIFVIGVFLEGGYGVEMVWRDRVAKVEAKVAEAQAQAVSANQQLETEQQQHQQYIKQLEDDLSKQIHTQTIVINQSCKLDPVAVDLYNKAVTGTGANK
jgi:type VI protein secretion system component VasK